MPKAGPGPSRRAEILRQLLPHINSGNYETDGTHFIFGPDAFLLLVGDEMAYDSEVTRDPLTDAAQQLGNDLIVHAGRVQATTRSSLSGRPKLATNAFDKLSQRQRQEFLDLLRKATEEKTAAPEPPARPPEEALTNSLDAFFSEEVLGKLPKIVRRASTLDEVGLDGIADEGVRQYFEEAHRCYLYGFQVACAVLCRAILESSLKRACDPHGQIQRKLRPGQSHFQACVDAARNSGMLTDDRPEWAIKIRDAGNYAIHDFPEFKERWGNKVDEILLNTRKVLLDLFA